MSNSSVSNISYWEKDIFFQKWDFLILGAGIVGLNAGIELLEKNPNAKVLILERGFLPDGASTKNAGFACFGSPSELMQDLQSQDEDSVFSLFNKRYQGIQTLLKRISGDIISYAASGGYEVIHPAISTIIPTEENISYLNSKIEFYTGLKNAFKFNSPGLKEFGFQGFQEMISAPYEGILHPAKLIQQLLHNFIQIGGKIYWNQHVINLEDEGNAVVAFCANDIKHKAKKCIVCLNGFAKKLLPSVEVTPARNHVYVYKSNQNLKFNACFHLNCGYIYFRNVHGMLLLGGARNLFLEKEYTDEIGENYEIKLYLEKLVKENILPEQQVELMSSWSGIMGLGPKKEPIIQMHTENIGIAVRMGGMGVAIGTNVGIHAATMLINQN